MGSRPEFARSLVTEDFQIFPGKNAVWNGAFELHQDCAGRGA
jgi:hypothetical protein